VGRRLIRRGAGITRTISISKTIKIKPRRKNRKENGIRALFLGSNPHSKGEVFSRSHKVRVLRAQAAQKVKVDKRNEAIKDKVNRFIYRKYYYYPLIKSQMLFTSSSVRHRVLPIFNVIRVIRSSGAVSKPIP
jgi:hypothetical protein